MSQSTCERGRMWHHTELASKRFHRQCDTSRCWRDFRGAPGWRLPAAHIASAPTGRPVFYPRTPQPRKSCFISDTRVCVSFRKQTAVSVGGNRKQPGVTARELCSKGLGMRSILHSVVARGAGRPAVVASGRDVMMEPVVRSRR